MDLAVKTHFIAAGSLMGELNLEWIEHHPGLAAWVQAIGAIIAIIAAFVIANLQHALEKRDRQAERKERAKGLAFLLHAELLIFAAELERYAMYSYRLDPIEVPTVVVAHADQLYYWVRPGLRSYK
jgi:hypothetical protein